LVGGQPGQKVFEIISTKKVGMVVHACNPSYTGSIRRKITVQAGLGKKCKTLSKI
jgi:hypothetical protein